VFIKNISFAQDLATGQPLLLTARAAQADARLRFAVEISTRTMLGEGSWDGPHRIQLGEIRDVAKEQYLTQQVIHVGNKRHDGGDLYWGNPAENYPVWDKPVQARLVIIGSDATEQFYEFLLIEKPEAHLRFLILMSGRFDWETRWANKA
jgi:hypothetical protein